MAGCTDEFRRDPPVLRPEQDVTARHRESRRFAVPMPGRRGTRVLTVVGVIGLSLVATAVPVGADSGPTPRATATDGAATSPAFSTALPVPAAAALPTAAAAVPAAVAPQAPAASPAAVAAAQARISRLLPLRFGSRAVATYLGRRVSIQVEDAITGRVLWSRSPRVGRLPASNLKVLTAAAVLSTYGPSRRLATQVVRGRVADALVLRAGGDPLLTSTDLDRLAASTAAALTTTPTPSPTSPTPTPTSTTPPTPSAYALYVDDGMFASPTLAPGWSRAQVPGTIRLVRALVRDRRILRDTSADAASYFAGRLRAHGLNAVYRGRTSSTRTRPVVASFAGHTVLESVRRMLIYSDNNVAEMLLRDAAVGRGRPGTWLGGTQTIRTVLARLGIALVGLRTYDGSGLSRGDRVPVRVLTAVLRSALKPANASLRPLFDGGVLPVAGRNGTLSAGSGRYNTAPSRCARDLIWAKTGSLHDVVGLTGYARGSDGRVRAFSMLVNARPERYAILSARRALDRLASTITGCW